MHYFYRLFALLFILALGAGLSSACTSEQPAASKKSSKEGKKDAKDDDDDDDDDDGSGDDDGDSDDEAEDDEEGCKVEGGLGESSGEGSELALTLATVTWTADIKPYLTSNNCLTCHKVGGEAEDYATYEGAFKNIGAATEAGLNNEPKHSSLTAGDKSAALTILTNWHMSFYARGSGFDEFEMAEGADYAALQEDYTDKIRFVFEEKCVLCHNKYNAETMPWATGLNFGDFTVLANSTEGILKRLNDSELPMPPKNGRWAFPGPIFTLSSTDKNSIVAWFEANKAALAEIELDSGASTKVESNPCD